MIIDTHCHLNKDEYDNLDEVIKRMDGIMITAGSSDATNIEALEVIGRYDNVYGVLGIHPEEVDNTDENSFKLIEDNINNPKVVGLGEMGLDYYWVKDNKDKQKEVFIRQLELANKYNKTAVIHCRDAIGDCLEIIKRYPEIKKVMHCYSGSVETAKELIKMNVMLGIGGVVTFAKSDKLKEVIEGIDISYLILETDSPYLSPVPLRGKKNEPANTIYIANKIAEIKGLEPSEVIEITARNAIKQFDLPL
jgi:TatD DNase family protein